ncbi:TRAP transporter small permease [Alteribacillus sp. YIM 98480]|uniref:TRAP transporter small permease n=1 Tax=Alteribacillus sp. YIM 98480 TaxID=2606599 RepID=UPI00131DBBB0|nr:TRAP transporter small permease [Alteribacillus sp. YIM 98480]
MWKSIVKTINRSTEAVTILALAIMVIIVFIQVISRALIGSSFSWTDELARFLMFFIIFVGAGIGFQHGSHITIEILFDRLPRKYKKLAQSLITILSIVFLIVLSVQGFKTSLGSMSQTSPALNLPMGYVYLIMPLAAFLMIINLIDLNIKAFVDKEISLENEKNPLEEN